MRTPKWQLGQLSTPELLQKLAYDHLWDGAGRSARTPAAAHCLLGVCAVVGVLGSALPPRIATPRKTRWHHPAQGYACDEATARSVGAAFVKFDAGAKGYLTRHELRCAHIALLGHAPSLAELDAAVPRKAVAASEGGGSGGANVRATLPRVRPYCAQARPARTRRGTAPHLPQL